VTIPSLTPHDPATSGWKRPAALRIAVVASSARDIEAPSELVCALPTDCGAVIILVRDLPPARERAVLEALAERTTLPVMRAHDGLVAEQGHIYVIPPQTTLTVIRGHICITPLASGLGHLADNLFTSLAEELGGNAIGVILSGGGSDGALGIRAIKLGGGTTFAQYPGFSRYPDLPISAIETGCVDFVLRPNEIAHHLTGVGRHVAFPARLAGLHNDVAGDDNADSPEADGAATRELHTERTPGAHTCQGASGEKDI
jgi:two-component system CheB/CheR fusion protein